MRIILCAVIALLPQLGTAKPKEVSEIVKLGGKTTELHRGFYENGNRWYVHYWRKDQKVGTHQDFNEQGKLVSEVRYKADAPHGKFTTWHDGGAVKTRGRYRDGGLDGLFEAFYPDAKPKTRRTLKKTLPHGDYLAWHPNGQKRREGRFKKGAATGVWTEWNAKGEVIRTLTFKRGVNQLTAIAPPKEGPLATPDFGLAFVSGSPLEGYDFHLRVGPTGRARHMSLERVPRRAKKTAYGLRRGEIYYETRSKAVDFQLTPADFLALRKMVAKVNPWTLQTSYVDPKIEDGSQWHVRVRAHGNLKQIDCSNRFPKELGRLKSWLEVTLLPRYAMALLAAKRSKDTSQMRRFELE